MKYCVYSLWELHTNSKINEDIPVNGKFDNFFYKNKYDSLEVLNKYLRPEEGNIILSNDDKLYMLIIPENAYRKQRILSTIEDLNNNRCLIATSLEWFDFTDKSEEDMANIIEEKYNDNYSHIEHCVNNFLKKLCKLKFSNYRICDMQRNIA